MIINFITDKNDKNLLKGCEKLYDGFAIRYKREIMKKYNSLFRI